MKSTDIIVIIVIVTGVNIINHPRHGKKSSGTIANTPKMIAAVTRSKGGTDVEIST
jgi:hypothetical protein